MKESHYLFVTVVIHSSESLLTVVEPSPEEVEATVDAIGRATGALAQLRLTIPLTKCHAGS